jgi:site-specific DNA recombinase
MGAKRQGLRVLGRVRLSRYDTGSTSVERQRELIEQWAKMNDHTIVGWAEDVDLSGSVDVLDGRRKTELGEWLRNRQPEFDCVAVWKLDRLSRSTVNLNRLFVWCSDHGKTVVSVTESIDLSTPIGRLIANVLAFLAEGELEAIKERTKASRKKLVESGRWPGGPAPFGFESVKLLDGGFKLEPREDQAAVIRRIYRDIVSGLSMEAVAKRLNADKVPSAQGTAWRSSVLFVMMESKLLLGHSTYKGQTVRDAKGSPVMVSDPILSQDEWDQLQAAIAARRLPSATKRTQNTSPLYGVIFCHSCGSMMYHRKYKGEYKYEYYMCPKSCGRMIHAAAINTVLERVFLSEAGAGKVRERVYVPAESHEDELSEAKKGVEELSALFGVVTSDTVRKQLTAQLTALDARIAVLESMPSRESRWEYRDTGETYAEAWQSADTAGRRELLVKSGITLSVLKPKSDEGVTLKLSVPRDIAEQMGLPQPGTLTEALSGVDSVEFDLDRFAVSAVVKPLEGDSFVVHTLTAEGEAQAAEFYGWE